MRAAERVGPEGHVIAIDYAEPMIVRACAQAQERGFQNIEFRLADMTKLGFPDDHFDAVVCVLGVFFVDDMVRQISEFWRMVRPGGQLAITNIGPKFFLPMFEVWKETIQKERPDLTLKYPWERANDPEVVFEILSLAGLLDAEVLLEHKSLPLRSAEDWWNIVMGTGLRRTVEEIGPEAADRVRKHNLKWIKENNTLSLELSIIYAIATKP
jgi:SAM-dependent methyltransferase